MDHGLLAGWLRRRWLELCLGLAGLALIWAYRWLLDDAFIYFRYVDNWVLLGRGLVYNPGEYVEGYSSQLWPLVLALPRTLEISYWTIVAAWGLIIGAGAYLLTARVNDALGAADDDDDGDGGRVGPRLDLPLAILAVSYGPATYFTGGLETPLVQLAAPLVALFILRPERRWLGYALALIPIVRPELCLAVGLAIVAVRAETGRWPWPAMIMIASLGLAALGLRIWYYADLVPNTYYVKDTFAWARGWAYFVDGVRGDKLHLLLPGLALLGLWLRRRAGPEPRRRSHARLWMAAIAGLSALYTVRIGGDMVQYRYLAFPIWLAVLACGGWAERARAQLRRAAHPVLADLAPVAVLILALTLFAAPPHYLSGHPLAADTERIPNAFGVSEAHFHRQLRLTTYDAPRAEHERTQIARYPGFIALPDERRRVFAHRSCARGYIYLDSFIVNSYGLTEPILAHMDAPEKRVGHRNLSLPAEDIQDLRRLLRPFGAGSYRRAVERGVAPTWVVDNLDAIEAIEARVYNDHDFVENLRLALARPPTIHLTTRELEFDSGWD